MRRRHGRLARLRRRAPLPAGTAAGRHSVPGRHLPRGFRPAPRLVPLVAPGVGRGPWRRAVPPGAHARVFVDETGRKMSKSRGNVVAPQKVMQSLGADVLRLWVAATDYSGEMSVSDEI